MDNQLHHDSEEPICSGNAVFGHDDNDASLPEPETIKNVMVVGGGWLASKPLEWQRSGGHHVTVYEAADRLGGQLIPAIVPPYKQNLADYIPYMEGQAEYRGFTVELNHPITREEVERLKPDVVIVADRRSAGSSADSWALTNRWSLRTPKKRCWASRQAKTL